MRKYQDDLRIDPDNLDLECITHAGKFQDYAEKVAEAKIDYEKAERELEVSLATIELDIRKSSTEKLTEAMIKAKTTTDPRTVLAYEKYFSIKRDFEIIKTAISAFNQRGNNLTDLVRLHGQTYFASPDARPLNRRWIKDVADDKLGDKALEVLKKFKKGE